MSRWRGTLVILVILVIVAACCCEFQGTLLASEEIQNSPTVPGSKVSTIAETADKGRSLFERNCVVCHGIGGTGGRGPSLTRVRLSRVPDDAALRAVIEKGIAPEMPDGRFLTDEDVGILASYVRSLGEMTNVAARGDAVLGRNIFARGGCPACHIVGGQGAGYGPELTDVGERRSAEYLHQAILKPAEHLPADFLMVRAMTTTGDSIQGIRVNEDTFTIQVKDPTGNFHSFRKADLKELRRLKGETPMPSFEGMLTDSELQDLVAYLESPGKESLEGESR